MPALFNYILTPTTKEEVLLDTPLPLSHKQSKHWINITADNEEKLTFLFQKHNIHQLTIEDILNPNSRIKLEKFPNYIFFIFRGFHFERNQLTQKNFNFILTPNQIISLTLDYRDSIGSIIDDWKSNHKILAKGYEFIVHKILDIETDHTLAITQKIEERIDHFEDQIFSNAKSLDISNVYSLRSSLLSIKKGMLQNKEVLEDLEKIKNSFFSDEADAFFRDVRDHSIRILELVDSNIESISSALEAHIAISTRKTNEIMKILTIMTAIMLPMSLVAGIYGMNFRHMPSLEWEYGFASAISAMGLLGFSMLVYFRIKRWY
ncbi:magnesium transporter CorA family protein [Leptospira jelokensis]|uniref:Magnesium transporter n=1 Tax=Leptospira jelokensis TaxID=2484931 RepID=A0A4Z0ZZB1_9LEPT|nr:magnesium transporter CorA family protein [Leptospira jelokensis]TGL62591.1 magnesium transporter [Leptospira jelokensis]TGM06469.1 magnesium transporter [Leptospira jelokensis]